MEIISKINNQSIEIEKLRIEAKATEVNYRQKGEIHTAERFEKVEIILTDVVNLLKEAGKL